MQLNSFNPFLVYGLYNQKKLIYIGHTNNLIRRINNHKKQKKFNDYKILHKTKNLRLSLYYERKMIRSKRPPLNKKYNRSFNEKKSLQYLKILKKPKKKQKTSFVNKPIVSKTIQSKEFTIFKNIESYVWKITKTEIKDDEEYLKQILNMVKTFSFLNIKSLSQKIIEKFEKRLPTDSRRINMWVHLASKIFREEKRIIKNKKIAIKRREQALEQSEIKIFEEKLLIKQQKDRNKKVFDPLDVEELTIIKPIIQSN